jgi:glycosyltransferase involved in cell wall biosynthesis
MKVLVIVPAYNEEENIAAAIQDLRENYPEGDILVVNDGSADRTSQIARELGAEVLDLPYNLGIGGAMQTGFLRAVAGDYAAAIQFDGDGQHNAVEIRKIFGPYENSNADLVVGSRFLSEGGFTSSMQRRLGARILSLVVSTLVRRRITDTTSGFRFYSKKAFTFFSLTYPEDYPEVEAFILAHKKGLTIEEVPAEISPRQFGKSSITISRAVYYMAKVLLAIFVDLLKKIE